MPWTNSQIRLFSAAAHNPQIAAKHRMSQSKARTMQRRHEAQGARQGHSQVRTIDLPAGGWKPRPAQMPLWTYLENGGKNAVAVWHRRDGKDELALRYASVAMVDR